MTDLLARRRAVLGDAYRLFYDDPVELVRGEGVWLFDADGRRYLDGYNNVACVGHCHPRVVDAIARQAATLNTHTRYLHPLLVEYAERLVSTMPAGLDTVMLTCTGSEANDLALRLATSATGRAGVIVTRTAYHGVTAAVAAASPSLGSGVGPHVRTVAPPQPGEPDAAARLAADVAEAADDLARTGFGLAALLVDTVLSSDGLVPGPAGFLAAAARAAHAAGGLVIADEVQAGFGRTGAMWGFERHGMGTGGAGDAGDGADAAPDLVTLGKPMGNGHPVAGVVFRRELGAPLARDSRYFNTFGGNPVSCAAGLAVLDVIADEGLVAHAGTVGARLLAAARAAVGAREGVRDVRGVGLYLAVQVADGATAAVVVNAMRRAGVLIAATGPGGAELKIRPPLVIGAEEVDLLVGALSTAVGGARG